MFSVIVMQCFTGLSDNRGLI